ncbi:MULTISPECIES: hypothetical protein [Bradyrhizobium]|nr:MULTISPECIES: hypothetical protein [Bradyrhizobium]
MVKRDERSAAAIAMLKSDSDHYSAHGAEFFQPQAVAAGARNI